MKTIGLIGGMSWESTIPYYEIINERVKEALGGFHSAKILLYSVDFAELEACLETQNWDKISEILGDAAKKLERGGADVILIGTNTMHNMFDAISAQVSVPFIHIADAAGDAVANRGMSKIGLLGTKFTMTMDFYKSKLENRGFTVIVPDENDMEIVNSIIFDELCLGKIKDESRDEYKRIISKMQNEGAEGVILGCTEIGLLVKKDDADIPLFDTTLIHAEAAAQFALSK